MVKIEELKDFYFVNDEPVPYTLKCGVEILIYPIKVKNWNTFERCMGLLLIDKSETNNVDIIRMSDFDYLINILLQDESKQEKFGYILRYSLNIDFDKKSVYFEVKDTKYVVSIKDKKTNKTDFTISSKDYKDLKKIILYQNLYDYNDIKMSADVKQIYLDKIEYESQLSETEAPTLEKKKIFVMTQIKTFSMKEINEISYRIFSQMYDMSYGLDEYGINTMLKASPKFEVKKSIVHPLYEKKKTIKDMLMVEHDTIKNKLDKIQ